LIARVCLGLVLLLLAAGCGASRRPPATFDDPSVAPWELPPSALATQRLYRVGYQGPDGGGNFRLTLLLGSADRYQVRAVDPIGRALWSLDVEGDRGLWIDHRAAAACRLAGSLDLAAGQLTPFPLAAIPALLLGRLPAVPVATPTEADRAAAQPAQAGQDVAEPAPAGPATARGLAFLDRMGRRWTATVEGGAPVSWSMSEPGQSTPGVWWRRHGGESLLSDRERGVQLTWRESVVERLSATLQPLAVPPSYALVPCSVLHAPSPDDGTS
jgi:hypothetical protein